MNLTLKQNWLDIFSIFKNEKEYYTKYITAIQNSAQISHTVDALKKQNEEQSLQLNYYKNLVIQLEDKARKAEKKEISDLKGEIGSLRHELNVSRNQATILQSRFDKLTAKHKNLADEKNALRKKLFMKVTSSPKRKK